jgi:hypothetical protein
MANKLQDSVILSPNLELRINHSN